MAHSSWVVGVAADWERLPAHLGRVLPGLVVESQETLELGRHWSFRWMGQPFELDAYVYSPDESERLSPDRIGGEASKEKIGDLLVEFDFKPDLLWQFANVMLHLRVLDTEGPGAPAARERSIQVARAVQSFLEVFVVSDLQAVTPRLEIATPEEHTILLGAPLSLTYQAVNAAPGEYRMKIHNDGFRDVTQLASQITVTPERVGTVGLWLSLQNTRSALRSPHVALSFQSVREHGRAPVSVQARYLDDASIEESAWRLGFHRDPHSSERTTVFFISLGDQSAVALQFGGPRYSNAPPGIAMRLQKALLLDRSRAPVALRPSELHIDHRRFPEIRGTISLASQDWDIAAVTAGSPADGAWMEALRRLGLDVAR
ncbi:MAG TPA: hypothetical protein VNM90_15280 [Haliangium sp.]|nr:hypothetical protein [Haliangium sp.]